MNTPNKPPAALSKPAKKLWLRLSGELDLDGGGWLMLDLLCEAWDRREQARAAIVAEGAVSQDRFGQKKPSPWVAIERDSTLAIQRSYHALGLDLAQEGDE
jgi:P27 family predicted phage terminase small subunit